ncbi:MAG: protein translocase subunit SecF [Alphaproteobacteria bacterium]|nr:MAG: protein translocase subunit SecF [Alphaproteobacteria bacterium]
MRGIRFVPQDCNVNFIGMRMLAFVFSIVLVLGSIGITVQKGLNLGIDFTGGTVIEIRTPVTPNLEALRMTLNDLKLGSISIQEFGQIDDLLIRLPSQKKPNGWVKGDEEPNEVAIEIVRETLDEAFEGQTVDYRRIEYVGPQVGKELKMKGLYAIIFSLLGIMTYIWFRFEWQFGVAAIIALGHDAIATIGLFALMQMEFNLSTVAAILMIAGYSINDTVVVFDRVRENLRKYKKKPLLELFNLSVNQTLSRTLMTSVTTLLALVALYVFGGEVIRGFVYALIFGIAIGTYSSVFVASPVLLMMNVRRGAPPSDKAAEAGAPEVI